MINNSLPKLENSTLEESESLVSNEDIRMTIFSLSPLKALGPDGLHALFFSKLVGANRKISV